jgi:hypothetical protein
MAPLLYLAHPHHPSLGPGSWKLNTSLLSHPDTAWHRTTPLSLYSLGICKNICPALLSRPR